LLTGSLALCIVQKFPAKEQTRSKICLVLPVIWPPFEKWAFVYSAAAVKMGGDLNWSTQHFNL